MGEWRSRAVKTFPDSNKPIGATGDWLIEDAVAHFTLPAASAHAAAIGHPGSKKSLSNFFGLRAT
jgi:hypothetical protein